MLFETKKLKQTIARIFKRLGEVQCEQWIGADVGAQLL
jgi:hypothetical protein